jgi:hypothetical protein
MPLFPIPKCSDLIPLFLAAPAGPLQLHCDNRRLRCGITIMSGSANSGAPMSLGHTLSADSFSQSNGIKRGQTGFY